MPLNLGIGENMTDPEIDATSPKSFEQTTDFANYFCTYGYLYHQKQMLTDMIRMKCYHSAIMRNPTCFQDKVVLDVGTGSGILAIWAAQAGARKVYAVEATGMAKHARTLVKANKLDHIVEVIQGKIENIELDEKVDIIVSEWMGYLLLRESMLDSVLVARDKWLKPGGALYPSHASIFVAPMRDESQCEAKYRDYAATMDSWTDFVASTKDHFGVDMSCLSGYFRKEQEEYFLKTSIWAELNSEHIIANEYQVKHIDILTCTLEDITAVQSSFEFNIDRTTRFCGFAGWFDVDFKGSPENPTEFPVNLSTSPYIGTTHWGQQVFLLQPPVQVCEGDVITGKFSITRRSENQRLLNVCINHSLQCVDDSYSQTSKTNIFQIE